MNNYFKPAYMGWFYNPKTFWGNIIATIDWLKHLRQRAFRGWADCDSWEIASYLTEIMPPMLNRLKRDSHGYPGWGQASTSEKWDALLDKIIEGFEAGKRVNNDDYYMSTNADILTRKPAKEEVLSWSEASKVDKKIFNDNMKVFIKWFFHLWD